jgi:hypothetical protein
MHESSLKDNGTTNMNENINFDFDRYFDHNFNAIQGLIEHQPSEDNSNEHQVKMPGLFLSTTLAHSNMRPQAGQSSETETDTGCLVPNRITASDPTSKILSLVTNDNNSAGVEAITYDSSTDESDYETFLSNKKRAELLVISIAGEARHKILDRFMKGFKQSHPQSSSEELRDGETNSSRSGSSPSRLSNIGNSSHSSVTPPKRKLQNTGREESGDEMSDHIPRKKPGKSRNCTLTSNQRFACPYQKRDPQSFNADSGFGVCTGQGWTEIAKVK